MVGLTSCEDFLIVKPLNEIVETNYWDRKADVESVVYGCYSGLQTADCQQRMFIWGELRSENVTVSSSAPMDLKQVHNENILETSKWVTWKDFYQVINRCNTVIQRAPEVQAIDPNYTISELRAHIAEVTWLRTLAYFYLARTFRDIPYSDQPSATDQQDYCLKPTPFNVLLKRLSDDLEAVKDDALRLYPLDGASHALYNESNTSRVTKCAMYALLADLYLWQGEWQKCADNVDKILKYKMDLYEEWKEESVSYVDDIELYGGKYPLLSDLLVQNRIGYSYNSIFSSGNSWESIFELYFEDKKSPENAIVSTFFGNRDNSTGQLVAYSKIREGSYEGNSEVFDEYDYRAATYIKTGSDEFPIRKYYYSTVSIPQISSSGKEPSVQNCTTRSDKFANWIIYRLTDAMLMKAEALIEMGSDENLAEAFDLILAVNNRAHAYKETDSKCLKFEDYATQIQMRELLRKERNCELMFEGKRWFDLVRWTLREASNDRLVSLVTAKQKERVSAVRIQLKSRDALFWPYYKTELDVNPNLKQNAAYIIKDTSQK